MKLLSPKIKQKGKKAIYKDELTVKNPNSSSFLKKSCFAEFPGDWPEVGVAIVICFVLQLYSTETTIAISIKDQYCFGTATQLLGSYCGRKTV
uniref:Uncharacterized protein n=1 Tax=Solanum lycopersicum TaxID=4081 RepID=A0A3Q7G431_SOLLC